MLARCPECRSKHVTSGYGGEQECCICGAMFILSEKASKLAEWFGAIAPICIAMGTAGILDSLAWGWVLVALGASLLLVRFVPIGAWGGKLLRSGLPKARLLKAPHRDDDERAPDE